MKNTNIVYITDGGSYWPKNADINYYASKGMNVIRVPFLWQRIQPTLGASFATAYAASLDSVVAYATGKGVWVVLDVHNYARYGSKQIGAGVTNAQFADLWTKLANRYKANSKVIFGLMNEPNNISSIIWRDAAQVAVTAIRATGATNYILLPGNGFSGAWSWFLGFYDKGAVNAQSNAQLMPSVTDSLNKMIYEVHQYFDSNKSGTSTTCLNAPVGNSTLADFTFWLRENKKRAFLGEFGVANNANCLQALKDAVKHMHDNSDVWLGWTYWAGGNSWGEYIFTIQPTQNYTVDRAQMAVLKPYLHGLSTAVSITIPAPSTQCINQTVYDDARRNGWQDWSWAGSRNFSDTTQKHSGLKSLSFVPQNYEAIALSLNDATLSTTLYKGVEFYINGAPNGMIKKSLHKMCLFNVLFRWSKHPVRSSKE
jgi:endoglucanase